MNLLHMKYAVEVAKLGSLGKASESLLIATPNISRSIKELESDLGISIFERTTKGMELTPEGEEFINFAKRILGQIEHVEDFYKKGTAKKQEFSISVPRACYISEAFAEFSKILALTFSVNDVSDDLAVFADISKDDWCYPYVTALYLAGIVNGTSDTSFSPDELLTREQAVTMAIKLYETATSSTATVGQASFIDENEISDWALISTKKATRLNIIQGFPDGSFAPKDSLTRAQAATIIYNLAYSLKK